MMPGRLTRKGIMYYMVITVTSLSYGLISNCEDMNAW
jgi:hypothetical protein